MPNTTLKLDGDNFPNEPGINESRLDGVSEFRSVVTVKTITPGGGPTPGGTITIVDQNGIEHILITT